MRHSECRLSRIASVEFIPNFDGSECEPSVVPAKVSPVKVPVLLLDGGGAGIAVGITIWVT